MHSLHRHIAAGIAILGIMLMATPGHADDRGAAVFDKLKQFEGTWVAAGPDGKPTDKVMSVFHVVAAGHSIQEVMFPGDKEEMVNMYFRDGDAVEMIHYCAAGNQPRLAVTANGDPTTLQLEFMDATGLRSPADEHMHAGKYVRIGTEHLQTEWYAWKDGRLASTRRFDLVRKP